MSTKAAIVTGASGQDGSYLCELLLEKGYVLKCLVRRGNTTNPRIQLYEGDVIDQSIIHTMIRDCENYDRVEIYNLAAQSRVHTSFTCPNYTFETNTTGILNILEGVRQSRYPSKYRIYQASSSEMFGKVKESPQNEETPFYPRSVYGVSKLAAHWLVKNYRESYGLFACSGILFNHESSRRGSDFVTKKITDGIKHIMKGEMEFIELCLKEVGKEIRWEGEAENEVGIVDDKVIIKVSPKFYRPCEVDTVIGDASKIRNIGWQQKNTIHDLIRDMMSS